MVKPAVWSPRKTVRERKKWREREELIAQVTFKRRDCFPQLSHLFSVPHNLAFLLWLYSADTLYQKHP